MRKIIEKIDSYFFKVLYLRIDATLTGNYWICMTNLIFGNIMEACTQAEVFEIWYEKTYEYFCGHKFEEPSDTINTYDDVDGVMRAVSHLSEYTPVCSTFLHFILSLLRDF